MLPFNELISHVCVRPERQEFLCHYHHDAKKRNEMLNTHCLWTSSMTPTVIFFTSQRYYFYQPKPIYSGLPEANTGVVFEPYPKVRSFVTNSHDTDMPISTIRSWVLDLICALINFYLNRSFLPYCTVTSPVLCPASPISPRTTSFSSIWTWTQLDLAVSTRGFRSS